jgi:H+/Cl- antiporter ClcA
MTKLFERYSDNERKVLDFASYCALFTTLVFVLMKIWPSYVPIVESHQFLYATILVLCCISFSGTAYLFVRMLHHCAGSRDIRWVVRIVMLPLFLVLLWVAAVIYYIFLYRRIARKYRGAIVARDLIDSNSRYPVP